MPEKPIHIGGLFRCCIQAWDEYDGPEEEGSIITCKLCQARLILKNGEWVWLNEEPT